MAFRASTNVWGGDGRLIEGLKVPVLNLVPRAAGLNRIPHNHGGCQHRTVRAADHHLSFGLQRGGGSAKPGGKCSPVDALLYTD